MNKLAALAGSALSATLLFALPSAQAALMAPPAVLPPGSSLLPPAGNTLTLPTLSVGETQPNWQTTLQFAQFNSALGTLDSVTLSLSGRVRSNFSATNYDDPSTTSHFSNMLMGSLEGLLANGTGITLNFEALDERQLDGGSSYSGVELDRSRSRDLVLTSQLGDFIGNGTLDFLLRADASSSVSGDADDFEGLVQTLSSGKLVVTYHYTAVTQNVPEPGALALVGLALAAAGLARRRSR